MVISSHCCGTPSNANEDVEESLGKSRIIDGVDGNSIRSSSIPVSQRSNGTYQLLRGRLDFYWGVYRELVETFGNFWVEPRRLGVHECVERPQSSFVYGFNILQQVIVLAID